MGRGGGGTTRALRGHDEGTHDGDAAGTRRGHSEGKHGGDAAGAWQGRGRGERGVGAGERERTRTRARRGRGGAAGRGGNLRRRRRGCERVREKKRKYQRFVNALCRVPVIWHSAKIFFIFKISFVECQIGDTRQRLLCRVSTR
jgi:hypothetical protein